MLAGLPVTDVSSAKLAVSQLLARGPGSVVLTLGAGGVVFSGGSNDVTHIPAESVATVDTTVGPSSSLRLQHLLPAAGSRRCICGSHGLLLSSVWRPSLQ